MIELTRIEAPSTVNLRVISRSPIQPASIWVKLLALLGVMSIIHFSFWWFQPQWRGEPWLFWPLTLTLYFYMIRYSAYWLLFLGIKPLPEKPIPQDITVDAMTTAAPGEPIEMTRKSLLALKAMSYPHQTYLLDDSHNPELEQFCKTEGIHYITRSHQTHAKCGNVNNGLRHSSGDFVLIVDPDHVVQPNYLDRVLGHFDDPQVGFVQTTQAYYNQDQSFVAASGAEQTYLFYGPVMQGLSALNANPVIGTNCTFRRQALESIGLYKPGLAEDLHTSMALHGKGWHSVYVPEILARGLTPADLTSFLHQQLKWSRGVMELLLHQLPHHSGGWNWTQKLAYGLNMSYYFESLMIAINLTLPVLYLITLKLPVYVDFWDFAVHFGPWLLLSIGFYFYAQRWLCHPQERGLMWRGMLMQYLCFPAHLLGIACAMINKNIPYIATHKHPLRDYPFVLLWPQLTLVATTVVLLALWANHPPESYSIGMVFFACINVVSILAAILVSLASHEKMINSPLYHGWRAKLRNLYLTMFSL